MNSAIETLKFTVRELKIAKYQWKKFRDKPEYRDWKNKIKLFKQQITEHEQAIKILENEVKDGDK